MIRITMQREAAHSVVEELGDEGVIQFYDLSSKLNVFQRQHSGEVKLCEDLERMIRFFQTQIKSIDFDEVMERFDAPVEKKELSLDYLETHFKETEKELKDMNQNLESLLMKRNKSEELVQVIAQGGSFFEFDELEAENGEVQENPLSKLSGLKSVIGVVPTSQLHTFQVLINRTTRGNAIARFVESTDLLYDENSKTYVEKNVFIVFTNSDRMKEKICKVCETIGASIYDYPSENIDQKHQELTVRIADLNNTIEQTEDLKIRKLHRLKNSIKRWKTYIVKEKAVYNIMNMFDYTIKNSVYCEGWIPKNKLGFVRSVIAKADQNANTQVESFVEELETTEQPPTHFDTNDFTGTPQSIVNAYGIPRYKETNPAFLSVVTFPFLFAIMYGDVGHGSFIFAIAAIIVIFQRKLKPLAEKNDSFNMIFGARYVLLLMSMFSIYCGFLYNDFIGLSFNFFGTAYEFNDIGVGNKVRRTYFFGIDPSWFLTENKLIFYNSLKMKMAVMVGIVQMLIGVTFSGFNHIQYKNYQNLIFEYLPMMVILGSSFGYMCILIIYKWLTNWYVPGFEKNPPQLLNTMTSFFLNTVTNLVTGTHLKDSEIVYTGQELVHIILFSCWAVSIPWLLFAKPVFLITRNYIRSKKRTHQPLIDEEDVLSYAHLDDGEESIQRKQKVELKPTKSLPTEEEIFTTQEITIEEKDDGLTETKHAEKRVEEAEEQHGHDESWDEIVIHQIIHTIEFVLGTVSHTASYLRLWALSLAHAQLSDVFWNMTMNLILTLDVESGSFADYVLIRSGIGITIFYGMWFGMTLFVLLGMEALSCLLHALRLHWVEFQSKFFHGDGELFAPFNLKQILRPVKNEQI